MKSCKSRLLFRLCLQSTDISPSRHFSTLHTKADISTTLCETPALSLSLPFMCPAARGRLQGPAHLVLPREEGKPSVRWGWEWKRSSHAGNSAPTQYTAFSVCPEQPSPLHGTPAPQALPRGAHTSWHWRSRDVTHGLLLTPIAGSCHPRVLLQTQPDSPGQWSTGSRGA